MSRKTSTKIICPNCLYIFEYTYSKTVWGDSNENRALLMADKINVATCPFCSKSTKLEYSFLYTNSQFAVWYEPLYDIQINKDQRTFTNLLGKENYLATAPRIKDWNDFKNTIIKFEKGLIKPSSPTMSKLVQDQVQGYISYLQNTNYKQQNRGYASPLIIHSNFLVFNPRFMHVLVLKIKKSKKN